MTVTAAGAVAATAATASMRRPPCVRVLCIRMCRTSPHGRFAGVQQRVCLCAVRPPPLCSWPVFVCALTHWPLVGHVTQHRLSTNKIATKQRLTWCAKGMLVRFVSLSHLTHACGHGCDVSCYLSRHNGPQIMGAIGFVLCTAVATGLPVVAPWVERTTVMLVGMCGIIVTVLVYTFFPPKVPPGESQK